MPTIQLTADISAQAVLRALERLDEEELDRFVAQVRALRARRQSRNGASHEEALLQRIRCHLGPDVQRRYEELIAKRDAHVIRLAPPRQFSYRANPGHQADPVSPGGLPACRTERAPAFSPPACFSP